jgi:hypothetical protein
VFREVVIAARAAVKRNPRALAAAERPEQKPFEGKDYERWKVRYDPLRERLQELDIDPNEYAYYYELEEFVPNKKKPDEFVGVSRGKFTNFHDLRAASGDPKKSYEIGVEWSGESKKKIAGLPKEQRAAIEDLKTRIEERPEKVPDEYVEAIKRGEVPADLREGDPFSDMPWKGTKERAKARLRERASPVSRPMRDDVPRLGDQRLQIESDLGVHAGLAKEERFAKSPEHELAFNLNLRRNVHIGAEQQLKAVAGRLSRAERKTLERNVQRASLRGMIYPGDSERQVGSNKPEREEAQGRKQKFLEKLREMQVTLPEKDRVVQPDILEQLYRAELAKIDYDNARVKLAREVRTSRAAELAKEGKTSEEAESLARAELFQRFMVDESLILNKQKLAMWPEKERGLVRRLWEAGSQKYRKLGRAQRIAVSVGLGAAVMFGAGTVGLMSASATGAYAIGRRTVAAVLSGTVGSAAGEGVEKLFGGKMRAELEELEARERALRSKFDIMESGEAVWNLQNIEEEYKNILDRRYGIRKRQAIMKGATTMAVSVAIGSGIGFMAPRIGAAHIASAMGAAPPKASFEYHPTPRAPLSTPQPEPSAPLQSLKEIYPEPSHIEIDAGLAEVKQGDGLWTVIRRQLDARLHGDPGSFGLTREDMENQIKVSGALDRETANIIDREFGGDSDVETRIMRPGIRVELGDDNHVSVSDPTALREHIRPGSHAAQIEETKQQLAAENVGLEPDIQIAHEDTTPSAPKQSHVPSVETEPEISWGKTSPHGVLPEDIALPADVPVGEPAIPESVPVASQADTVFHAAETTGYGEKFLSQLGETYQAKFKLLPGLGKDYLTHLFETRGTANVSDAILESDFRVAAEFAQIPEQEVLGLESLGFTRDFWFAHPKELIVLSKLTAGEFLGIVEAAGDGTYEGAVGKGANLYSESAGAAHIVVDEHYLRLAELSKRFIETREGGSNMPLGRFLMGLGVRGDPAAP